MARIYTRTGDDGSTRMFGGKRVRKDAPRICAQGTVDELNCVLGLARSWRLPQYVDQLLAGIQNDLFHLGAARLTIEQVRHLEQSIDRMEDDLPPLREFILPAGAPGVAALHFARAVCRRAERECVRLPRRGALDPLAVMYLNRLSDLLFVMARWVNHHRRGREARWKK